MKFKDKLKSLRTDKGLSRKDLADKTGISVRTIESYEQGNREPKEFTLFAIAEVLDVEPMELIQTLKAFKSLGDYIHKKHISENEILEGTVRPEAVKAVGKNYFKALNKLKHAGILLALKEIENDPIKIDYGSEVDEATTETGEAITQLFNDLASFLNSEQFQEWIDNEWIGNNGTTDNYNQFRESFLEYASKRIKEEND